MSDYYEGVNDYNREYDELVARRNECRKILNYLKNYTYSYTLEKHKCKHDDDIKKSKQSISDANINCDTKYKNAKKAVEDLETTTVFFDNFYGNILKQVKDGFDHGMCPAALDLLNKTRNQFPKINNKLTRDAEYIYLLTSYRLRYEILENYNHDRNFVISFYNDFLNDCKNINQDNARMYVKLVCRKYFKAKIDVVREDFDYFVEILNVLNRARTIYVNYQDLVEEEFEHLINEITRVLNIIQEEYYEEEKDYDKCVEIYNLMHASSFKLSGYIKAFDAAQLVDFTGAFYSANGAEMRTEELKKDINSLFSACYKTMPPKFIPTLYGKTKGGIQHFSCLYYCSSEVCSAINSLCQIDAIKDRVVELVADRIGQIDLSFLTSVLYNNENVDVRVSSLFFERVKQDVICTKKASIQAFVYLEHSRAVWDDKKRKFITDTLDKLMGNSRARRIARHSCDDLVRYRAEYDMRDDYDDVPYNKPFVNEAGLFRLRWKYAYKFWNILTYALGFICLCGAFTGLLYCPSLVAADALPTSAIWLTILLVGGTLTAFAISRLVFFGRESQKSNVSAFVLSIISTVLSTLGLVLISIYLNTATIAGDLYINELILVSFLFVILTWVLYPAKKKYYFFIPTLVLAIVATCLAVASFLVLISPIF